MSIYEQAPEEPLVRAQRICAETLRDLPNDIEPDIAFAEFKRRLGGTK